MRALARVLVVSSASFLVALDVTIVNLALPSMSRSLAMSQASLSWVVNAYALSFGGFLLVAGRAADVLGPRRTLTTGLLGFSAAALAGALAPTPAWLIGARAAQGLAASLLPPAGLALIGELCATGPARHRALGCWGAAAAAGPPTGAVLGGLLVDRLGWTSVLWVNVPFGLCAAVGAWALLPRAPAPSAGRVRAPAGAARRHLAVAAVALVAMAPLYGMGFYNALYLQGRLRLGALEAGLVFLPYGLVSVLCAPVAARAITCCGARRVLIAGNLALAGALLLHARVAAGGGWVEYVLLPSLPAAVGATASLVAVSGATLAGVPPSRAGVAGGIVVTAQQAGAALGLAAMVAVFDASGGAAGIGAAGALDALRWAHRLGAGMALGAAVAAALLWRPERPPLTAARSSDWMSTWRSTGTSSSRSPTARSSPPTSGCRTPRHPRPRS